MSAVLGIVLLTPMDARAQNPIIDQGSADPSVKVFGGRAYVYGSHDFSPSNKTWIMKDWKVFSSADLVTWTDHGVVLDDDTLPWRGVTDRDFAPDAIFYNGQYYFYFPLGDGTIGVAAGASPAGPFTDILGKALVNGSTAPIYNIDPMAIQDNDGSRYLIWGNGGCYIAQLNDDMKSFKTSPQKITIAGSQGYMEGPFAWMYGGKYYLLYSRCGSTCRDTLDYGVASSLQGPYTYRGTIIGHCKFGNEHGSVFQFNGQWYVAYHDLYPTDFYRKTKLELIHYTNDGDIPRVYPTDYGVGRYDGNRQIESENYFDKSPGLSYEDCTDAGNGFDVTGITSDSWLKFQQVDLGTGADSFQARVAASSGTSSIEIRVDGVDGTLVGTCEVAAGDQTWTTVFTSLEGTIAGVRDVFLVFKGGTGNLFKLNWIRFTSSLDGGLGSGVFGGVDASASCGLAPEAPGCSCRLGGYSGRASLGGPLCILGVLGLIRRRQRVRVGSGQGGPRAWTGRAGRRIRSGMATFAPTQVAAAAAALRRGEIVAFPTETYYGLAVDALDGAALDRLFELKGRDGEKASALLVSDLAMFAGLCTEVPARARELVAAHWPGPLTLALPAKADLPSAIVRDGFVAARVSSHPVAQALVTAVGRPITATSANPAGAPPPRTVAEVRAYFGEQALHVLDGGPTPGGPPSTLARLRGEDLEVLRRGAIEL